MTDEQNPYTPPKIEPAPTTRAASLESLGVALPLVLLTTTLGYVIAATMHVWDFPRGDLLRGAVFFGLAASSLWMLFQRRVAVVGYFFLTIAGIPLEIFRYGSPPMAVVIGFAAPALVVLALVWNKSKTFR